MWQTTPAVVHCADAAVLKQFVIHPQHVGSTAMLSCGSSTCAGLDAGGVLLGCLSVVLLIQLRLGCRDALELVLDPSQMPTGAGEVLSCCQSLVVIDNELIGDPLEKAALQVWLVAGTGWLGTLCHPAVGRCHSCTSVSLYVCENVCVCVLWPAAGAYLWVC
jgi:hypothetical protein